MGLTIRDIVAGSEDYDYVADLYDFSFPKKEQEKLENMLIVSETPLGKFAVILDGETRVGLLYLMVRGDLVFIYYLAVDPGLRSKGYGSEILKMIRAMYPGYRFSLNAEAPDETANNNEQRLQRISFYEMNGFRDTGTRTTWDGVTYAMMTSGGEVGTHEIGEMFKSAEKIVKH